MIVDKALAEPLNCICGNWIYKYSIGYGRTPYMIHCRNCKLDLHKVAPSGIGGTPENAFRAWNDYCNAVEHLKEKTGRYRISDDLLREYFYLKYKDKAE